MALLEVRNLVVHYGKALALEGVSLAVEAGELVGVLGPNGAGKTTLLKAISRAVPSRGEILFDGRSLGGMPAHEVVAEGICHCPEGRRLFPELTVLKNLQLGAYLRSDKDGIAADLERVYALFPVLRQRSKQQASTLSGGEQQMVAIGRALMGDPRILLLDEPSGGLAPRFVEEIGEIMRRLKEAGMTMLMVEQNLRFALKLCDRFIVLRDGKVIEGGRTGDLAGSFDDIVRTIYL